MFAWQHDNPTARTSSPFPLAKPSSPYQHTKKKKPLQICFLQLLRDRLQGRGRVYFPHLFPPSTSGLLLQGRKHIAPAPAAAPSGRQPARGWKCFTLHLLELWKHGLLLNQPGCWVRAAVRAQCVCFGYSKEKRKGQNRSQ